jgi:hypothetical protein
MVVVGEYNREGYRVVNRATGNTLFVEGNAPGGGTVILDLYNRYALPLHTIRFKCETKTREIANAEEATFGGVERVDESV